MHEHNEGREDFSRAGKFSGNKDNSTYDKLQHMRKFNSILNEKFNPQINSVRLLPLLGCTPALIW